MIDHAHSDDAVISYINREKEELRTCFRAVRMEYDHLQRTLVEKSEELDAIKEKLSWLDDLVKGRLQEIRGTAIESPVIPQLGRFANMGVKDAVIELFDKDPEPPLTAVDVANLLHKEGFETKASNPEALVFTTCDRLCKESRLSSHMQGKTRKFFRKT